MASKRILIVDDEENIGRSLRMILEMREGYSVNVCKSVTEFGKHPDAGRADAYLLDMKLPDGSGIDLLKVVRQNNGTAPAIMISGHGTIADAVEATRAGAFDFLEKPLSRDRVMLAVKNAMEHRLSARRTSACRANSSGTSPKMIGSDARVAARRRTGQHGGPQRRARAPHWRIGHREGTAGGAHPHRQPVR